MVLSYSNHVHLSALLRFAEGHVWQQARRVGSGGGSKEEALSGGEEKEGQHGGGRGRERPGRARGG